MFTHAGLLPRILAFLHTGKDCSSPLRRLSLKSSQIPCSPLPPEAVSHGMLPSRSLKRLKLVLKSRIIILLSAFLTSLKLHSLRATADHILRIL